MLRHQVGRGKFYVAMQQNNRHVRQVEVSRRPACERDWADAGGSTVMIREVLARC
jgi:hypothetical protein